MAVVGSGNGRVGGDVRDGSAAESGAEPAGDTPLKEEGMVCRLTRDCGEMTKALLDFSVCCCDLSSLDVGLRWVGEDN